MGNPDSRVATYLIAPTELAVLILSSHEEHTEPTYRKQRIQLLVEEELVQRRRSAVASIAWVPVGRHGHWITLGARGPGTSDYMLRTLRSLVKFTWLLISDNILGTFQM